MRGREMAILNRCPECGEWMVLDGNHGEWQVVCLQCDYSRYLGNKEVVTERRNGEIWEKIGVPSF
jgi:hypothetical protein